MPFAGIGVSGLGNITESVLSFLFNDAAKVKTVQRRWLGF